MPTKDLQWPMRGVVRRMALRTAAGSRQEAYPCPWAVNVRVEDPLDRRLRGGSRSGLTKYVSTDFGTTISDLASINVSRTTGAATILLVLVDSSIKTVEGGTVATPAAYLTDESGNILTDADENRIIVSSGTAPASGFLVTGQQHVFAVTTAGVTKMDPKTGQVDALAASAGSVPTSCTLGAVYRDRLVLSGADNAVYMSRQGDYTDWDYGQHIGDQGRALAFQLALGADVGPLPTAVIPHKDAFLICATARTLWVVQGDPAADGALRRISETVGIVGRKAWCRVDDSIVFLSDDGLYMMQADGSNLTPLSPEAVPDELRDVDPSTTTVSIGYEQDRTAYHVYLRTAGGSDTHWLYEVRTQAWWPMRLQNAHSPLAVCQHEGELLLAGNDGYIRQVGGDNDDGAAIQSHATIGPVRMARPGYFGRMPNMHAMLAAGGGEVNWRLVTGDTAEEAADNAKLAIEAFQSGGSYSSYVKASGNWISGRAVMAYPRIRGVWVVLWLQSTNKWAFEGVEMTTEVSGTWRGSSAGVVRAGVVSPSSSPSASPSSTPSASPSSSPSSSPSASTSSSPSSSPSASVSSSPSASTSSSPSSSPSST